MRANSTDGVPQGDVLRVAHLTTVDLSLRFLLWPQLLAVVDSGAEAYGISSPGPWVAEIEGAGIRHIPLKSSTRGVSLRSDVRAAFELWRVLRSTPITILHTHNPKPGIYGRILGRLAGVPVVVNTLHGFYATETDRLSKRAVVYGLEAVAARFSDAELHQNIEDLDLAKKLRIVRPSRANLLGNGIDLSRFDPSAVESGTRARIRDELGASESDVVVGTVGRLVAEKGFPELFEAAAKLGPGIVLAVIGPDDPDKPDALSREVIQRAETAGVRFLGMRTDMEDLYAGMDLFVLPSHREGFPRAAMEAAAMGLPVVATDIRGCRQVVSDGVNGLLIPVRDAGAIEEALRRLAQDPVLRESMSAASRNVAERQFDDKKVVEIVIETYRRTLEEKGLAHLLPAALLNSPGQVTIRQATSDDAPAIADLHVARSHGSALPRLGRGFSRLLFKSLLEWPGTTALVAEDGGGLTGYVAAIDDRSLFFESFVRSKWLQAAFSSLCSILRPATLARAWLKMLRHDRSGVMAPEVLGFATGPRMHGSESPAVLVERLVDSIDAQTVVASVDPGDTTGMATLQECGFVRGDGSGHSNLVWRA